MNANFSRLEHLRTGSKRGLLMMSGAILSVAALGATESLAQYRVDNGNALDANNRLGSGGFNGNSQVVHGGLTSNYIVTGNVTAGRGFRGSLGYTDPSAFRGNLPSASFDSFVRNSSSITTGGVPSFNANVARPFYGSQSVTTPTGFVTSTTPGGYRQFVPQTTPLAQPFDSRIDYGGASRATVVQSLPTQVQTIRATRAGNGLTVSDPSVPQRATAGATSITPMAPVTFGGNLQLSEYTTLRRRDLPPVGLPTSTTPPPTGAAFNQGSPLSQQPAAGQNPNAIPPGQGQAQPQGFGQPLLTPGGARNGTDNGADADQRSRNIGGTGQSSSVVYRGAPPRPGEQRNAQLRDLRNRMRQLDGQPAAMPGADAQQQINDANAAVRAQQAQQGGTPGTTGGAPGTSGAPGTGMNTGVAPPPSGIRTAPPGSTAMPPVASPSGGNTGAAAGTPMKVTSFADGIETPAVADLVRRAEAEMKAGKFTTAAGTFEEAIAKAPDDRMVMLGQSLSVLSAGYYRVAEIQLRRVIDSEPALLLAQYDLRGMVGAERLSKIVEDLKKLSTDKPGDPGPLFLLAFVYYNTDNEARAMDALQKARDISGDSDGQVSLLIKYWTPRAQPQAGESK